MAAPAPPTLNTRLLAEAVGTFGFFFIGFSGIFRSNDTIPLRVVHALEVAGGLYR